MIPLVMLMLDFGTPKSPVMPGWTAITPHSVATDQASGWVDPPGIEAQDQHWPREVPNASRGRTEPPPVYTNELTRDACGGTKPAKLKLRLPAGEYVLWAVAGSSANTRGRLFDFNLSVGGQTARFQMSHAYWFETRRLTFTTQGDPVVDITPRSRWILSGLCVAQANAAKQLERALAPLEQELFALPADLMAQWKETPPADPMGGQLPAISAADRERGYLVHQRHYLENIYPKTVPYAAELNPTLRAFATLGEYEPLTFAVYGLRETAGGQVTVSDLRGPGVIAASNVDVKVVEFARSRPHYTTVGRWSWVPDYLRPFDRVTVPAGENRRFWLTVHVPDDAKPGLYAGEATFTPAGTPAAKVPIRFRVLDLKLQQDPDKVYGIYYRDPLDQADSAENDPARQYFTRQAELQGADMMAHGTVMCVPLGVWISVPKDPQQPLELKYDWAPFKRKIERCKRYGYSGPFVVSLNTNGLYQRHMKGESLKSHIANAQPAPEAFSTEYTAMVRWIEAQRREQGLPEFLYYPVDEPGGSGGPVQFMVQCLKAIRAGGGKTYVTADPTHEVFEPMRPHVDVWCTQPFLPGREEILKDSAARGVQYWCYPNHINGENDHTTVAGARLTYGFGFWRSGFKVLIPWIYSYTSGHPFNNLDGTSADFFNRPGPDGTVWPVPMWEAYREGYDDYRYVYTCQQAIARARQAGQGQAADAAQAVLDRVWKAVEVKPKYKLDGDCWGYREFDVYRWQIAEQLLKLKAALGN